MRVNPVFISYVIILEALFLNLYMAWHSSLEKTVFSPFASEASWDDWEIRDPDQPTQQTCLRRIEEARAGKRFPLRLV